MKLSTNHHAGVFLSIDFSDNGHSGVFARWTKNMHYESVTLRRYGQDNSSPAVFLAQNDPEHPLHGDGHRSSQTVKLSIGFPP